MVESDQIASIILAGGKSSRMGSDKALIEIDGIPLLRKACLSALSITNSAYIITPWVERYQFMLPKNCHLIQEKPLAGGKWHQGPLVGFIQAFKQIDQDWVLLLACDLPNLPSQELRRWLHYFQSISGSFDLLLPRHSKGWEPLCGFYHRRNIPALEQFIASGGRSFQAWLRTQIIVELPVSDPQLLWNCNTRQDLTDLKANKNH